MSERLEPVPKHGVGLRCTICNHPSRPQIDLAIATGLSKRAVARRFGVSNDAVWRHRQAHLTAEMRAALATKLLRREGDMRRILLEEGTGVVEALKAIRGPLFGLFLVAIDTGDSKAAAALAARLHESLALAAKLTGELAPHAGVSAASRRANPRPRGSSRGASRGRSGFPTSGIAGGRRDGRPRDEGHRGATDACLTWRSISHMRSTRLPSSRIGSGSCPTRGKRRFCARARRGSC